VATLFLIRHGLTAVTGSRLYGRTEGIHLDDRGRRQAAAIVDRFDGVRLSAIYSSPLERCVETVQPLADAQRLEVRIAEGLVEMDAGAWTGRTLASLRRLKLWKTVQQNPSRFHFPGGEGFADAQARIVDEVDRIARRHPRGRVAISTHGDLVRVLITHFGGAHLDHFQRVIADPGSVSAIHLDDGTPRILLVNDTGSLRRFAPQPWERGPRSRRARSRDGHAPGDGRRDGRGGELRG
jgi:probable phosphoglycerate mutase